MNRWVLLALAVLGVGALFVGLGGDKISTPPSAQVRNTVFANLRQTGPNDYESSVGSTRLIFPASSWENARSAGLAFEDSLAQLTDSAWSTIGEIAQLGLSDVYFSSLYRATGGTGPHTKGRGIDLGYVQRSGDAALTLLKRDDAGEPEQEPALAQVVRNALVQSPHVTQVLSPWWMFSKGSYNRANDGMSDLDVEHFTHMHVTTAA